MKRSAALLVGVLSGFADAGHGQSAPQPPSFEAGVTLIKVDVSVLDRDRRPVGGLTVADFTLLEDGAPQSIQSFTAIELPPPPDVSAVWMHETPPDVADNATAADHRLMALVIDDRQIRVQMTARVKATVRDMVDGLGPGDRAAVVFTRNNRSAQDFTEDHARLLAAVDAFSGGYFDESGPAAVHSYRATVETLRNASRALAAVPDRRKAIVFVSVGIPVDFAGGLAMSSLFSDVVEVFREAQRANVSINCIDPSGLGELDSEDLMTRGIDATPARDRARLNRDFLRTVAENTGGLAIVERNDWKPGVTQLLAETGTYYLLGYQSSNTKADGKFRKIAVKLSRADLTVRARSGYYASRVEKPTKAPPASEVDRALGGLLPRPDLNMRGFAAPFALPGRREAAIALVLGMRQPAPSDGGPLQEQLDVSVSALDSDGALKASRKEGFAFKARPDGDLVAYDLLSQLDLKPGRYQLRVAARSSALGKTGSVFYDVDVPDFSKEAVSLSGLVLGATPAPPATPTGRLAALTPVVPTTLRDFTSSTSLTAFVKVYQGRKGAAPISVTLAIKDARGVAVLDRQETISPEQFDEAGAADFRVEVPLSRLTPGPYLLSVDARAGGRAAARTARFTIE